MKAYGSSFAFMSDSADHHLCIFLEMRRKFDAGEDPLDAESQQGGGHPFHRGWNSWQEFDPFSSGGPFQFKFHFN